jgi:hypothetical protein
MRLLVDTDAFCKLAIGGVLDDAIEQLGVEPGECGRLPALPYMLQRGRLRKRLGDDTSDALIPVAENMPKAGEAGEAWLDRVAHVATIDPGEAQLFAAAAEAELIVVSGDKRALRALKDVEGFPEALSGRIVVLEAILLALCDRLGVEGVRERVQPLAAFDKTVKICFSAGNRDPTAGLLSYYENLANELSPLVLWDPRGDTQ